MTGDRAVATDALLKLTTYFGERDRTDRGLLADALLDLYASQRVRTSLLLRGSQGFGRLHHLRSDRLLSLSDDLPVVSIAVDTRARIERLLPDVTALQTRGLITLERARAVDVGEPLTQAPHDECKLTVYLGRRQRAGGLPAFVTVCELLHRHGLAGATVLLGVDGTRGERRLRARFVGRNAEVPVMVMSVGPASSVSAAAAALREIGEPTATIERVRVCKRDGVLLAAPDEISDRDERGFSRWRKLSVYSSQHAVRDGRPLDLEIVRQLRAGDCAGVTSLRGIWGFHGDHPPHGDRLLQVRRHVPVLTVTVDTPERSARAFEVIDALTNRTGLVTSETVPALRAMSAERAVGGLRLARRQR